MGGCPRRRWRLRRPTRPKRVGARDGTVNHARISVRMVAAVPKNKPRPTIAPKPPNRFSYVNADDARVNIGRWSISIDPVEQEPESYRKPNRQHNQRTKLADGKRDASVRCCPACSCQCTTEELSESRHVPTGFSWWACKDNTPRGLWTSTDKSGQRWRCAPSGWSATRKLTQARISGIAPLPRRVAFARSAPHRHSLPARQT
jgi:hypothetical protein